jgi:putative spermidine/putrescine transport system permease protein
VLLQREGVVNAAPLGAGLVAAPWPLLCNRGAVLLAMVHILLPCMVLPIAASLCAPDAHLPRAATSLGATAAIAFRRVTLPLSLPGVGAGCLPVFIQALGVYVTPALLGGPNDQMLAYFIGFTANRTVNWGLAATLLGTLAAFGLWRARFAGRQLAMALLLAPMVVPSIIVAVALLLAFGPRGLANTHLGMIIAHAAPGAPFVVVTVLAALQQSDERQLRAAASRGATPSRGFLRICLPRIAPGVAAGAVFAFATSLDEVVVVLVPGGPAQRTLPRQMFSGLNDQISLTVMAAASVRVLLSVLLLLAVTWLRRR